MQTMFINTLGIKKGVVDVAMQKKTFEITSTEDSGTSTLKCW